MATGANPSLSIPACDICGETAWKPLHQINGWDIVQCGRCEYAKVLYDEARYNRKEEFSQNKIEKKIKGWNRPLAGKISLFFKLGFRRLTHRKKTSIFHTKIMRYLKPGASVLDIACGDGTFLDSIKDRFKCTGNEISSFLAQLARERTGLEIVEGDFVTADFGGKKFDAITMISLIEHLKNPREALQKCFDLLNPEGVLLLKTVNYDSVNRKWTQAKWTGFRPPDHLIYFTPANLETLLKSIGFKTVKSTAWPFNDNFYTDSWK